MNTALGGTEDYVYLVIGDLGSNSGHGLDFVLGMTFLCVYRKRVRLFGGTSTHKYFRERFYHVFDTGKSQGRLRLHN